MLRAAYTFSMLELRRQINRLLLVSFSSVVETTLCVYTKTIILFNLRK